jgi:hypothetical protein
MGGLPGQSGKIVGYRTQPGAAEDHSDIEYSATDNRVECPNCGGQWFMVKDSYTIDSGALPSTMEGYGAAGEDDMIIFLCHCGTEFGQDKADWTAQGG